MISRRRFIKTTLVTGALTGFPGIFIRKAQAAWARKTPVHPNVDDLRVVGMTDKRMTKAIEPKSTWFRQNELVNPKAVWENMDRLACTLTKIKNEKDAWKAIFVKPPKKSWADTVIAIKTNNLGRQHTRNAVMAKVGHTLTDIIGVKGSNIHIYDGCHGNKMVEKTPFFDLPEGCRIEGDWGGIKTNTVVPKPWPVGEAACLKHLVDGHVDIIVNIAMCKGHERPYLGNFTMVMKNHLGTFAPKPAHDLNIGLDYLMAINQTQEILGEMDKKTGRITYPRQQLCIIDALWASKTGPGGFPSAQPNFLAMGVLAAPIDYLVATKFRDEIMGWKPTMSVTKYFLTAFGYTESDLPEGGRIIEP